MQELLENSTVDDGQNTDWNVVKLRLNVPSGIVLSSSIKIVLEAGKKVIIFSQSVFSVHERVQNMEIWSWKF